MDKIMLPICIPYLKEESTGQHNYAQLSLSLLTHLSQIHFPDQKDSKQLCYSLLRTASTIEELPALEQIQTVPGISCRKMQNLLGCRVICPACPYSSSYQNQQESEESLVLSYALQDYSSFDYLFSFNLKPTFFKALFYCKSGDSFLGYPLHSSLYQYMLKNFQLGSQRNQMLRSYFDSLKDELNQEITGHTKDLIQTYINNLIKNGKTISAERINITIQAIQDARKLKREQKKKASPAAKAQYKPATSMVSLDFMLSATQNVPKPSAAATQKPVAEQSKTAEKQEMPTIKPSIEDSVYKESISPVPNVKFQGLGAFLLKQAEIVPPAKPEEQITPEPAASIITDHSFTMDDLLGYPHYIVTSSSPCQEYALFENKLLLSPFISLEGARCNDDDLDYILLYMDEYYFIFTPDCKRALQLLSSVLTRKSTARKFLSFDGYYACWLLSAQGIIPENLITLYQTFRFLHRDVNTDRERTPEELVTLLENRHNHFGLSFYCYAMKYYAHMYQQIKNIPETQLCEYKTDQLFHQLLGQSFYLPSADECSFNIDGHGTLTYEIPDLRPESLSLIVQFIIEVDASYTRSVQDTILKPSLAAMYLSQLCHQSKLQLILLTDGELRILILKEYMERVTESMHMLFSFYAECEQIYIKITESIPE